MGAAGSCADNAAAGSFFGVLKRERVNRQHYQARAEARADILNYIERSQSRPAAEARQAATDGTPLHSTAQDIGIEPACTLSLSQPRPRLDSCFPNKLRILFPKLAFNARE